MYNNDIAIENFINFCNDMMIAEEGKILGEDGIIKKFLRNAPYTSIKEIKQKMKDDKGRLCQQSKLPSSEKPKIEMTYDQFKENLPQYKKEYKELINNFKKVCSTVKGDYDMHKYGKLCFDVNHAYCGDVNIFYIDLIELFSHAYKYKPKDQMDESFISEFNQNVEDYLNDIIKNTKKVPHFDLDYCMDSEEVFIDIYFKKSENIELPNKNTPVTELIYNK